MFSIQGVTPRLYRNANYLCLTGDYLQLIMLSACLNRYTSQGSLLYSACDGGVLRRYRRYPDHHQYLGEVYKHKGDIQDLDISPYDECILLTPYLVLVL